MVDYLVYRGLVLTGLAGVNICKAAGFLVGSVFAYVVNRLWTFGDRLHHAGSWVRFGVLYAATLLINTYINAVVLSSSSSFVGSVELAFVTATGVSATLNFLGMNYFVFWADRNRGSA